MKIYLIADNTTVRLIRASTRQQALRHVASTHFTIRVASQDDLVKHLNEVPVENAAPPEQIKLEL